MNTYCESCPIDGDPGLESVRAAILDAFVRGLNRPSTRCADRVLWWEPKTEARNVFRCGVHVPNGRGRRAWDLAVNGGYARTMEYVTRLSLKEEPAPWRLVVGAEQDEVVAFGEWFGRVASARMDGSAVPTPPAELNCGDLSRLLVASRDEPQQQVGTDMWHHALRP